MGATSATITQWVRIMQGLFQSRQKQVPRRRSPRTQDEVGLRSQKPHLVRARLFRRICVKLVLGVRLLFSAKQIACCFVRSGTDLCGALVFTFDLPWLPWFELFLTRPPQLVRGTGVYF